VTAQCNIPESGHFYGILLSWIRSKAGGFQPGAHEHHGTLLISTIAL
jgi:hypothetical protein